MIHSKIPPNVLNMYLMASRTTMLNFAYSDLTKKLTQHETKHPFYQTSMNKRTTIKQHKYIERPKKISEDELASIFVEEVRLRPRTINEDWLTRAGTPVAALVINSGILL